MKKTILSSLVLFISLAAFPQAPEAISYQALVRDPSGQILANQAVGFRIAILQGQLHQEEVYLEEHQDSTNTFGMVSLQIGKGAALHGSFREVNWAEGPHFLEVMTDINLSGTFTSTGITELLSVPFALYSKSSGLKNLPVLGQAQIDTLDAVAGSVVMNQTTHCLNYFTGTMWMEMCGTCTPQPDPALAGDNQTVIGNQTQLNATAPQTGSGMWNILSGTGGIIAEPQNPGSLFSGTQPGSYLLEWSVSTVCGSNTDQLSVNFINETPPPSDELIFAPYVDCLLWPNFEIQNVSETGICIYTCAFIVDNQSEPGANACWGGFSSLGTDYYQDKIAALRSQGGDIIMSFGGANGIELAYAAQDEYELRDAYKEVIEAYALSRVDFDIEGLYVAHSESVNRRSKALRLLLNEYPSLEISLTLPVMPEGLTQDGLNVVQSALEENVDIHCINIMAMDYGPSGIDMGDAAISAGEALFVQLKNLYQNAGLSLSDSVIWKKTGITPMIGENDVPEEVFYLDDAQDLAAWALEKNIGRLSLWSANRDRACENPNDPLYSCSHINQQLFEFSAIFGAVSVFPCQNK